MFPIDKIYLNLDFVLTLKTHRNGECYQFVQLCFLCKQISILFLLEISVSSATMYSFGNFQQQKVVYIGQDTTNFPEYLVLIPTFTKEGTLGYIHYMLYGVLVYLV
jgi:hypothetical protein